jgi:very-short-patch-repair endonuclease
MNVKQQTIHPNKLEAMGYALLTELGLDFATQALIAGKFCVDAMLRNITPEVIVQFDGDYWHGNPAIFPEPSAKQKRRHALDISQDAYMTTCGFAVFRIWESELKRSPSRIKQKLRSFLARHKHTRLAAESIPLVT